MMTDHDAYRPTVKHDLTQAMTQMQARGNRLSQKVMPNSKPNTVMISLLYGLRPRDKCL